MNAVWAYCCCVATDASAGAAGAPPRLARAMDGFPSHSCGACRAAVPCFDHHCPFTGGCVEEVEAGPAVNEDLQPPARARQAVMDQC